MTLKWPGMYDDILVCGPDRIAEPCQAIINANNILLTLKLWSIPIYLRPVASFNERCQIIIGPQRY